MTIIEEPAISLQQQLERARALLSKPPTWDRNKTTESNLRHLKEIEPDFTPLVVYFNQGYTFTFEDEAVPGYDEMLISYPEM